MKGRDPCRGNCEGKIRGPLLWGWGSAGIQPRRGRVYREMKVRGEQGSGQRTGTPGIELGFHYGCGEKSTTTEALLSVLCFLCF